MNAIFEIGVRKVKTRSESLGASKRNSQIWYLYAFLSEYLELRSRVFILNKKKGIKYRAIRHNWKFTFLLAAGGCLVHKVRCFCTIDTK